MRGIPWHPYTCPWDRLEHEQARAKVTVVVDQYGHTGLAQVLEILSGCCKLRLVWFGVPCGMASTARETVKGPTMPPQLRSPMHPEGLPELTEKDAKKVQAANSNTLKIIEWREAKGVKWCANSCLWCLLGFADLLNNAKVKDVLYSACMVGGLREDQLPGLHDSVGRPLRRERRGRVSGAVLRDYRIVLQR